MKFWEVLKAVDEGKAAQYFSESANKWIGNENTSKVMPEVGDRYLWRIKPEPKIFYCISRNDGSYFGSFASEEATNRMVDKYNNTPLGDANNRPYRAIKFVEVMED